MYSALARLLLGLSLAALFGCGQLGPLYLPDEAVTEQNTAPAAAPDQPSIKEP